MTVEDFLGFETVLVKMFTHNMFINRPSVNIPLQARGRSGSTLEDENIIFDTDVQCHKNCIKKNIF